MIFKDKETGRIVGLSSDPNLLSAEISKEYKEFFNKVKEGKYVQLSAQEIQEPNEMTMEEAAKIIRASECSHKIPLFPYYTHEATYGPTCEFYTGKEKEENA